MKSLLLLALTLYTVSARNCSELPNSTAEKCSQTLILSNNPGNPHAKDQIGRSLQVALKNYLVSKISYQRMTKKRT